MKSRIETGLANIRALQAAGIHMNCPRCGKDQMKTDLHTNALSRHADGVYVCDDCGTSEAMLMFMNMPLPLYEWAAFRPMRPDGDFKDTSREDAEKEIQSEQIETLTRIERAKKKFGVEPSHIDINVCGDEVELDYTLPHVHFNRLRRITGYLVGDMNRWNNGKRAEEADRVKHTV